MDLGSRLVRCVVGVGCSTLPLRLHGVCVVAMVVRSHDRQRRRPIFVVECPLCSRGWYQRPLSQSSNSGGDVVEGARASGPLAADHSSESPLTRTL